RQWTPSGDPRARASRGIADGSGPTARAAGGRWRELHGWLPRARNTPAVRVPAGPYQPSSMSAQIDSTLTISRRVKLHSSHRRARLSVVIGFLRGASIAFYDASERGPDGAVNVVDAARSTVALTQLGPAWGSAASQRAYGPRLPDATDLPDLTAAGDGV